MLTQALWTSLRILVFRAGPEDFPYDPSRRLNVGCAALGVLVNAALAAVMGQAAVAMKLLPQQPSPLADLLLGAMTVLAMGLFTQVALRVRQLENRFQQTFNALLCTSSVLALLMVLPILQLLPILPLAQELSTRLATDPNLANDPSMVSALPGGTPLYCLMIAVLLVWQFAVTAQVYQRAANTRAAGGILIAMLCVLAVISFKDLISLLLQ